MNREVCGSLHSSSEAPGRCENLWRERKRWQIGSTHSMKALKPDCESPEIQCMKVYKKAEGQ